MKIGKNTISTASYRNACSSDTSSHHAISGIRNVTSATWNPIACSTRRPTERVVAARRRSHASNARLYRKLTTTPVVEIITPSMPLFAASAPLSAPSVADAIRMPSTSNSTT
ncbi:hypothetical protein WL36_01060 [Burkholderia ubonensis]|nr:hypothetical protein WL36_01060 [Burkholderia ubonensis]